MKYIIAITLFSCSLLCYGQSKGAAIDFPDFMKEKMEVEYEKLDEVFTQEQAETLKDLFREMKEQLRYNRLEKQFKARNRNINLEVTEGQINAFIEMLADELIRMNEENGNIVKANQEGLQPSPLTPLTERQLELAEKLFREKLRKVNEERFLR